MRPNRAAVLLLAVTLAAGSDEFAALQRPRSVLPAPAAKVERLHVLSLGRDGSSFALRLFWDQTPCLREPLHSLYAGEELLNFSKSRMDRSLRCLYDCHECKAGEVSNDSLAMMRGFCRGQMGRGPVALQTVRVVDLGSLPRTLPWPQLQKARFVALLRDPRPQWLASRGSGLKLTTVDLFCQLMALQVLSLPELSAAVGTRLMVEVYERWIKDELAFSRRLAGLAQVEPSKISAFFQASQTPATPWKEPTWPDELSARRLWQIESDPHCRVYMARVGYRRGTANQTELKSYSELTSPLDIREAKLLRKLRSLQRP